VIAELVVVVAVMTAALVGFLFGRLNVLNGYNVKINITYNGIIIYMMSNRETK